MCASQRLNAPLWFKVGRFDELEHERDKLGKHVTLHVFALLRVAHLQHESLRGLHAQQ